MKKIKTLKMNYEFKNVFSKGNFNIGKQVIIYYLENKKRYNRIGIAVSSKLGKAIKRNHVKRLIRAAYQDLSYSDDKFYDIVFVWNKKNNIENASYRVILKDLERIFSKIGILK